jgi:cytochrome c553
MSCKTRFARQKACKKEIIAMKSALAALVLAALVVPSAYGKDDFHGMPPAGAVAQGATKVAVCIACHGSNGVGMTPLYPNLAGQQYNYLLKELENFRSGARKQSVMSGMAMTIPPSPQHANLKDIAAYFSHLKPMWAVNAVGTPAASADQINLGQTIYQQGIAADDIPSCAACHGLSGEGNGPMAIPMLAGQHAPYMIGELQRFANGKRANSPGHVMYTISRAMTTAQDDAVAAYLQQLNPTTTLGTGPKDFNDYARALRKSEGTTSGKADSTATAAAATTTKAQ